MIITKKIFLFLRSGIDTSTDISLQVGKVGIQITNRKVNFPL